MTKEGDLLRAVVMGMAGVFSGFLEAGRRRSENETVIGSANVYKQTMPTPG